MRSLTCALFACFFFSMALADEPVVERASATRGADGTYRFQVTVRHDDTGWDHYADRWEILDESGRVLATRVRLSTRMKTSNLSRAAFLGWR